jgi:hypothetical protein
MLLPIHVHYSNGTSGKFSSILYTILILHQVIITHFPHLTKFLVGNSLKSEQEMKDTAQDRLKGLATTFSNKGIQNPGPLYDKCLNLECDYIYQQVAKKIHL